MTIQGHSRSRILGQWICDKVLKTLCNNAGNISRSAPDPEFSDPADPDSYLSREFGKSRCRRPQSFNAPTGNPANIRIKLILPESRIIRLRFCQWWAPKDAIECVTTVQGHLKSLIWACVERAFAIVISSWSYLARF